MAKHLIERYSKEIGEFEEWIKTKPHLPQNLEKLLLLRFLKVYDFNLEKAKALLLFNLEMRKKNPIIFEARDVLNDNFQQALRTLQVCPMPKKTREGHVVTVGRLIDTDPEKYEYVDICRLIVTMLDARYVSDIDDGELVDGEIGVMDLSGFGFKHFLKCMSNLSVFRAYTKYVQEAAPFKIVQNHFINAPSIMDKFMAMAKPFMNKEVIESIKFHSSLETLYDYLPRDLLPNEFGGSAGSIDDINDVWIKTIVSKRDYLKNDDNWKLEDE